MQKTLEIRVGQVEDALVGLSGVRERVEELGVQFVQLRDDVRREVSSIRGEVSAKADELRGEMTAMRETLRGETSTMREELRGEMGTMREELRDEMSDMHKDLARAILSSEDRVIAQMRVLHEEVVTRVTLIGESMRDASVRSPRRRRR